MKTTIEIKQGTRLTATWVAAHARQKDRDELLACVGSGNITVPAVLCSDSTPPEMHWCAYLDGEPVAAMGVAHHPVVTPTIGNVWLFATDKVRRVVPAVSRHFVLNAPRLARERGIKRLEIRASSDHDIAARWIERLGARHVAELEDFGKNGETFHMYEWTWRTWNAAVQSPWLSRALEPCRIAAE